MHRVGEHERLCRKLFNTTQAEGTIAFADESPFLFVEFLIFGLMRPHGMAMATVHERQTKPL